MDTKQQILDAVQHERTNGLNPAGAEVYRWACWRVWTERGEEQGLPEAEWPKTMTSSEWADAVAGLGVVRGTAMNRHSEARRNWEAMYA